MHICIFTIFFPNAKEFEIFFPYNEFLLLKMGFSIGNYLLVRNRSDLLKMISICFVF